VAADRAAVAHAAAPTTALVMAAVLATSPTACATPRGGQLCRQCRPVCCARRDAVLYQYSQGTSTRRIRSFEYFSFDFVILSNTLLIARTLRAHTHRPACAGGLLAASSSVVVDAVSVLQTDFVHPYATRTVWSCSVEVGATASRVLHHDRLRLTDEHSNMCVSPACSHALIAHTMN